MSKLAQFGRFWYDFIIGDDWKIAAVVVTVLVVAAVLVARGVGSAAAIPRSIDSAVNPAPNIPAGTRTRTSGEVT